MKFRTRNNLLSVDSTSRLPRMLRIALYASLCTLPCLAQAVQIGDIVSVSKLGQPLRAEVALTTAANEHIDNSCISLVAPDAAAEDASQYLAASNTNLSLQNHSGQPHIVLHSRKPFNEVFAKFKLHIQCLGEGSITRTFTMLPDIDTSALLPEPMVAVAEPDRTPQAEPLAQPAPAPEINPVAVPAASFAIAQSTVKPANRARKHSRTSSPPRMARSTRNAGEFQLKISGDLLDASRIGKISDDERAFLLAKQKLLDSDDQMSSILELQSQIKQLQDDIVAMKSQFSQLGVAPARVNLSGEAAADEIVKAASAPATVTAAATKPTESPQTDWRTWAWQLGLLGLAILGVVWGLRRYADEKSANTPTQDVPEIISIRPVQKTVEPAQATQQIAPAPVVSPDNQPVAQPAAPGEFTTKVRAMAQATVEAKAAPTPAQLSAYADTTPPPIGTNHSEVDAIIEEAQLYAAFNHPLRAIKILQELLVDNPKKSEAWLLILAIYSSLKNEHEFENNARAFLRYNPKDHETWKTVQILGRTLNPTHALYRDNSPILSSGNVLGERHLLGDVLIDLEMISPESLHHCLAHFDPNQHGRFGAYLVTEKVITHEQLTQALVLQNTINQGVSYTPPVDLEFAPPDRSWQG